MTPEEKAKQYADSHNLKCASDSHAFVEVPLRELWENSRDVFLAGHQSRDDEVKRLREALGVCLQALEYINTHELYHGVNQGMPSEQTSKEALLRVEEILGNVSAALASQGEEE